MKIWIEIQKRMRELTWAMGMTRVRKAARYSASPSGGLRPPDQAMFTLNPSPSSTPHCVHQHRHLIKRTKRLNELKRTKRSRGNSTIFVYLVGISGSREEMAVVVPMDRYVKDARIVVKDLLRAVAMMNVLKKKKERNKVYKIEFTTVISLWRNAWHATSNNYLFNNLTNQTDEPNRWWEFSPFCAWAEAAWRPQPPNWRSRNPSPAAPPRGDRADAPRRIHF